MIKFSYYRQIEQQAFHEHSKKRKSPEVISLMEKELAIEFSESDKVVSDYIDLARTVWQESADKFLTALGNFYERELAEPDIYCYLIRVTNCPYNFEQGTDSWFAAPLFAPPVVRNGVVMHELCHYFQPQPLPRSIKEAIPVILNDHHTFGMYNYDGGHSDPEEQKWRQIIWDIYQQGGKFSDLLNHPELGATSGSDK